MILDGWGDAPDDPYNAISEADTPVFDKLKNSRPYTTIAAHGSHVGLPDGQMGNSEVGHLNLGAGRVVRQELVRIGDAICDGSFKTNKVFSDAIKNIKAKGGRAHVIGLCSPGGVHSSMDHMYALVDLLFENQLEVIIHAITDGRDTPPSSAAKYIEDMEHKIAGKAKIATVAGRFYAMDRDNRWDRIQKSYEAFVNGAGDQYSSSIEAIKAAYSQNQTDEFIKPAIITDKNKKPSGTIKDNDGVFFFNFRADRAREITAALALQNFNGFIRNTAPNLAAFVCMTQYQDNFNLPVAFAPLSLNNILGQVIENNGQTQFKCAETEKYAHVTFFFNGGSEQPFEHESRKLVSSPADVETYDLKPAMSAAEVADEVVNRINNYNDDFILVNFANTDMVGHTGIMKAAIQAAQVVDEQIGRIYNAVIAKKGAMLITADHGNSEQMLDKKTGEPFTAHTLNPVPLLLIDDTLKNVSLKNNGSLQDVAPTVLELMNIAPPKEMTGRSLIKK